MVKTFVTAAYFPTDSYISLITPAGAGESLEVEWSETKACRRNRAARRESHVASGRGSGRRSRVSDERHPFRQDRG